MAKKTGKKPYKFRQARKDAKAGAKGVFTGKRKAAVKDITTKQTLEEREALKELSDARKRQRAGKADFIVDDRGQRVDVKPTETPQERIARDRAEARRIAYEKYPLDETELDKQKARKARMEAKNKAAIAKQKADKARNLGRNAPTLQQTPANEKPLSRPVKKAAVKKGTVGTTKKPDAKGIAKVVEEAKAAAAKNKPQIKKAVAEAKAKKYPNAKPVGTMSFKDGKMTFKADERFYKAAVDSDKAKAAKKMTRAERSAANKAAWKNMSPAERKNWSANKPTAGKAIKPSKTFGEISKAVAGTNREGGLTPRQESALQRRVAKTDKKLLQIKARDPKKFAAREKIAANPKLTAQQKVDAIRKVGYAEKPKPAAPAKPGKYLEMQQQKRAGRPTEASLRAKENAYLASKKPAPKLQTLAEAKAAAPKPKGTTTAAKSEAKPAAKPAAKKVAPKKFARSRALARGTAKGGLIGAAIAEAGSIAKGSTEKDWKEIQRLENKLAALKGKAPRYKNMGSNKNPIAAMKADLGNLAANATFGIVGKTRRGRMDELNRMIAKQEKKNANKATKPSKPDYSVRGRGPAAQTKVTPTAGGSTIASGKYTVQKGDTLSGIAKNAGVSLSELRALNPAIMKRKKYKQGNMIWSGTKVNIPKKQVNKCQ